MRVYVAALVAGLSGPAGRGFGRGVVGAVGNLLAQRGVNIGQMNLGIDDSGRRALTIVKVDQKVGPHLLEDLRKLDNVLSVKSLVL